MLRMKLGFAEIDSWHCNKFSTGLRLHLEPFYYGICRDAMCPSPPLEGVGGRILDLCVYLICMGIPNPQPFASGFGNPDERNNSQVLVHISLRAIGA
jgi:hypothetical protein